MLVQECQEQTWFLGLVMWQNYCLLKLFPCADKKEDTENTGPIIPRSLSGRSPLDMGCQGF